MLVEYVFQKTLRILIGTMSNSAFGPREAFRAHSLDPPPDVQAVLCQELSWQTVTWSPGSPGSPHVQAVLCQEVCWQTVI